MLKKVKRPILSFILHIWYILYNFVVHCVWHFQQTKNLQVSNIVYVGVQPFGTLPSTLWWLWDRCSNPTSTYHDRDWPWPREKNAAHMQSHQNLFRLVRLARDLRLTKDVFDDSELRKALIDYRTEQIVNVTWFKRIRNDSALKYWYN